MEEAIEGAKWRKGCWYDELAWLAAHLMAATGNYGKTPPTQEQLLGRSPLVLDPRVVEEPEDDEAREKRERTQAFLAEHHARMNDRDR